MSEGLLAVLKFCFLAVLWLFFIRVIRVAWKEVNAPPLTAAPAPAAAPRAASGPDPAPQSARITIVEPADRRGRSYDLRQELTLGRGSDCDVALADDSYVSQRHARLYRKDGRVWLEDLGSTNGTYLNAKPVSAPVALHRGDRLQVGRTVLEVNR